MMRRMAHDSRDIHELVYDEIMTRIRYAESELGDSPSPSTGEPEKTLADLHTDLGTLRKHWMADGLVHHSMPPLSQACRNPQPCPHTLALADKYGLLGKA
jgi:hypothetical protein